MKVIQFTHKNAVILSEGEVLRTAVIFFPKSVILSLSKDQFGLPSVAVARRRDGAASVVAVDRRATVSCVAFDDYPTAPPPSVRRLPETSLAPEAKLHRQVRSQVQLGNEENSVGTAVPCRPLRSSDAKGLASLPIKP